MRSHQNICVFLQNLIIKSFFCATNHQVKKANKEEGRRGLRAKTSAQIGLGEDPGPNPAISKDRPTGTVPSNVATPASASQLPIYIRIYAQLDIYNFYNTMPVHAFNTFPPSTEHTP